MSHFTKQVQDGQKQSKFFPSASLLLSIKAGWPCHGKISRRFTLSSHCNGLIHCANDDLSMSPQGKIKLVVVFTSNASYQTSQLITFSYYWLRSRGWKKWPRGKKLSSFPLKKWILNRKRVTNRAGEEFSSIHWSKICCHLYLPTEYQNTLVQAGISGGHLAHLPA